MPVTPTSPTTSTKLSAEQAAFFRENGYLVLRQVYTGSVLTELQDRAHRLRELSISLKPSGMRFWYGKSCNRASVPSHLDADRYSWGINEITRRELFDTALISSLAVEPLNTALHAILDRPRVWGLKILWAPKDSRYDLSWHRDIGHELDPVVAFKPDANDHVQYNAALEYDNSFIVVPRSHRRPLSDTERELIGQHATCELPDQIRVELEPGDIVLMDAHAVHRGQAEAGAPRLSLHYSFQAQWVPLMPWGDPAHFAWISSQEFIQQLTPQARPYYERLNTAERAPSQHDWMVEYAKAHGWDGSGADRWPGRKAKSEERYAG